MQKRFIWLAAMVLGLSATFQAQAADDEVAQIRTALKKLIPQAEPDAIEKSELDGMYEVSYGLEVYYVSKDGRYLMSGNLIDVETKTDLTEEKRAKGRLRLLNTIDEKDMIIFKPEKVKHVLTVFTDLDCGYCRKLHSEMDQILAKGIEVRYLFFPRAGVGSNSYKKAISVWCSADRQQALTDAKLGKQIEEKTCDNPVDEHMELVRKFGLTGTPSLVMSNGKLMPGYVPADRLAEMLDSESEM